MNEQEEAERAEKYPNHLHFYDEIEELKIAIDRLGSLVVKIEGKEEKEKEPEFHAPKEESTIALSEFLKRGGEEINSLTQRVIGIRDKLESLLY